jgi:tRNA A37 methylthiotransferase MiaB
MELIQLMKERANICKTIHLPAQSGSTSCLERMRRGYTREAYLDLISEIRHILPACSFTSDFISGFCGETEQEHLDTLSLMKLVGYSFCFMYPYSMREKTKAFYHLKDDVNAETKSRRYTEMVHVFRKCASDLNELKHNEVHLVLVDMISKRSNEYLSGRNDQNVIVIFPKREVNNVDTMRLEMPQIGDYVACRIVSSTSQSLKAEPLFLCTLNSFYNKKNLNK